MLYVHNVGCLCLGGLGLFQNGKRYSHILIVIKIKAVAFDVNKTKRSVVWPINMSVQSLEFSSH